MVHLWSIRNGSVRKCNPMCRFPIRAGLKFPRSPCPPFIDNMDDFPSLFHQAFPDPSPMTPPRQSFSTDKCRHGRATDFHKLQQALPIIGGGHVFFIPTPSIPTQFGTEINIAKSELLKALFEFIPLKMFEPAGGETPHVHNGLDLIVSQQGYKFTQGSGTGADAIDPLPKYGLPLSGPHVFPLRYQRNRSFSSKRYRRPSFPIISLSRSPYWVLSRCLNRTPL